MKPVFSWLALVVLVLAALPVSADRWRGGGSLHHCLKKASNIKNGYYAKLEYLPVTERGVRTYEIEIKAPDGTEWEFMCDMERSEIYEIEREVESASDPLFRKHMQVNERTASRTALELYPGKLVHTEYEIESNGSASYEFDIYQKPGVTYKIEVSAATGEIVEVNIEKWDIGREAEEE